MVFIAVVSASFSFHFRIENSRQEDSQILTKTLSQKIKQIRNGRLFFCIACFHSRPYICLIFEIDSTCVVPETQNSPLFKRTSKLFVIVIAPHKTNYHLFWLQTFKSFNWNEIEKNLGDQYICFSCRGSNSICFPDCYGNNYIGADYTSQISSTSFRFASLDRFDLTDIIRHLSARSSLCSSPASFHSPLAIIIARLRLAFFLASLEDNMSILRLSSRKKMYKNNSTFT